MSVALQVHDPDGYPSDLEWTPALCGAADDEGWSLFDCSGSASGRTQLCRCDENGVFADDKGAWLHVAAQARTGSELHLTALRLVKKYNHGEFLLISEAAGLPALEV